MDIKKLNKTNKSKKKNILTSSLPEDKSIKESEDKSEDKSKEKSKDKSKEKSKKKKIKLVPPAKIRLRDEYRNKCEKDIQCIYNESSFKPKVKEIYNKPESFGFMIDVPNETPFPSYKNGFKPKCRGIKTPILYEEPKIKKKNFWFFTTKIK